MLKLEMILKVHQLKMQGFKVSEIARKCSLSRTTVYEYLEKDLHEAFEWVELLKTRKRKLDPYRDHIPRKSFIIPEKNGSSPMRGKEPLLLQDRFVSLFIIASCS